MLLAVADEEIAVGVELTDVGPRRHRTRFPVLALSISDDELMTLAGTHSLVALYENAPRRVQRIAPAELALRRIGHFGAFRPEQESALWPRMADSLLSLSTPQPA